MPSSPSQSLHEFLVGIVDRGFGARAWHGPNLRGALRGVSCTMAGWRPSPARHSIAEHVLHTAYWKYTVRRRIRDDRRGSFPGRGSNWFPVPDSLDAVRWKELVRMLEEEHRSLRSVVAELDPDDLLIPFETSAYTLAELIQEVSAHDVYHAGQIQLLKRLHADQAS